MQLASWFPRNNMTTYITRPVYKTDFNPLNYATRAQARCILGLLFIRELPIKNFYIRAWLAYAWVIFFVVKGLGRGLFARRPIILYNHAWNAKVLMNYPDLLHYAIGKVLPKNPPLPDPAREWATRQNPVFHQYHRTTYRYRYRKPRYVPWDGS